MARSWRHPIGGSPGALEVRPARQPSDDRASESEMLTITGLRKAYGPNQVLAGVDLTARSGEIVGLVGPNGAGKTTLVSIVAGLRPADSGTVRVGGVDALADPRAARRILGLAPQDLGIYPTLSARRNLEFFAELAGLRGRDLRRRVDDLADALDLATLMPRRAGELSGGQQRRLHTAMALVHDPRVLFLDEPTVGADVRTRGQVLEVVRQKAAAGCAIVYASHYLSEIEDLDATVAVLEGGRIIAHGPCSDLVAEHGSPTLRLTFEGPAPEIEGFTVEGSTAVLSTPDSARAAATVLAGLNGLAGRLRGIEVVEPSLEAAYLALTGRHSSGASPASALVRHMEEPDELVA